MNLSIDQLRNKYEEPFWISIIGSYCYRNDSKIGNWISFDQRVLLHYNDGKAIFNLISWSQLLFKYGFYFFDSRSNGYDFLDYILKRYKFVFYEA